MKLVVKKRGRKAKPKTLFVYLTPKTKAYIDELRTSECGKVSKSYIIEKVFSELRKNPSLKTNLGLT